MIIAILGSGGREHAIANQLLNSPILKKLYCIPGNAGTSIISRNVNLDIDDFNKIADFIKNSKII